MTTTLRRRIAIAALAFVVWTGFAAWHAHVKPADFYVFWAAARHWAAPYDPAVVIAQLEAGLAHRRPSALRLSSDLPAGRLARFGLLPLEASPIPCGPASTSALFIFAASFMVRPAWATAVLFIVPPVVLAVAPGQTSLLVGAAAIGGFLLIERSRRWRACSSPSPPASSPRQ